MQHFRVEQIIAQVRRKRIKTRETQMKQEKQEGGLKEEDVRSLFWAFAAALPFPLILLLSVPVLTSPSYMTLQ